MKLEWRNEENIGYYQCIITDDDGYKQRISVWDYTCEYQINKKANDAVYNSYHQEAFEVSYCNGCSMHESFDSSHTLEFVKIWCEDYLLDKYINHYNNIVANLEKIKSQAEWAIQFKNDR
jgi:hypothetical protein